MKSVHYGNPIFVGICLIHFFLSFWYFLSFFLSFFSFLFFSFLSLFFSSLSLSLSLFNTTPPDVGELFEIICYGKDFRSTEGQTPIASLSLSSFSFLMVLGNWIILILFDGLVLNVFVKSFGFCHRCHLLDVRIKGFLLLIYYLFLYL